MENLKNFGTFDMCDFYVLTELQDVSVKGSELQVFKKYWDKLTFLETEFYFWPQWTNLIFRWRKDRKIKKRIRYDAKTGRFLIETCFRNVRFFSVSTRVIKTAFIRKFSLSSNTSEKIVTMSGFIINEFLNNWNSITKKMNDSTEYL